MREEMVGEVSDFFARPVVAGIALISPIKVGDKIHVKGHTTDMEVVIGSMQIDNVDVQQANPGDSVGIKLSGRARKGDKVYKVIE